MSKWTLHKRIALAISCNNVQCTRNTSIFLDAVASATAFIISNSASSPWFSEISMMVADFSSSWTCLAPRQCTAMWAATAALGRTWPIFREKRIPKLPQNTRGNLCGISILQGWLSIFADERAWLDNCGSVASKRFGNASLESWSSNISRCRVVCGGFLSAQAVKSRASWRAKCLTILTAKQEIWNCNVLYI